MTLPAELEEACELIDAAMFSGDTFQSHEEREKLRDYMGRWERALDRMQALEDDENG